MLNHVLRRSPIVAIGLIIALIGCTGEKPSRPKLPARDEKLQLPAQSVPVLAEKLSNQMPAVESPPDERVADTLTVAAPAFRPDDQRPQFDDAALAVLGIHRYESKRLRLYTDIPAEAAKPLPVVIDAAYGALSDYFGPLPPSRTGDEFQMTGYLMQDEKRFREAGMIPVDLPSIEHGRHRRNEFWLREQPYDYYRRHLLIHEATHCMMMYLPENQAPVWYLEGMAEHFGTHRIHADDTLTFRAMPISPEAFAGFGRITLLRKATEDGGGRTMLKVMDYTAKEYLNPEPYAWSWAVCHFLDHHPHYVARFRELGKNQQPRAFAGVLETLLAEGGRDLATEWVLFITNLQYGYDADRAAITFHPGTPWTNFNPRTAEIVADRGWQSTRIRLEAHQRYEITATGQFTLAQQPKPWVSESDGISFRYFRGIPLGKLLACVRDEDGPAGGSDDTMLRVVPIGSRGEFTTPVAGTLYLRLNDSWSELADNAGRVNVSVRPVEK